MNKLSSVLTVDSCIHVPIESTYFTGGLIIELTVR